MRNNLFTATLKVLGVFLSVGVSQHPTNAFSLTASAKVAMRQHRQIPAKTALFASNQFQESTKSGGDEQRVVMWTVANLFQVDNTLLQVYHAAGAAWDNLVPLGAALGGLAFGLGYFQPYPTLLQSTGYPAWITGLVVMGLAEMKLFAMDIRSPNYDADQRCHDLKSDFNIRVMDQSVWIGCALGVVLLVVGGGPTSVGLAPGADGVVQGVCLGSVLGSALGVARQRMA